MGILEGIHGSPYLKHLIELWTGYCGGHFLMMNEAVRKQNKIGLIWGRRRPSNNELWICIGCILLVVICIKGMRLWKKLEEGNRNI